MNVFDRNHIAYEVSIALSGHEDEYDVEGILDDLSDVMTEQGERIASIDQVDDFWGIVASHDRSE